MKWYILVLVFIYKLSELQTGNFEKIQTSFWKIKREKYFHMKRWRNRDRFWKQRAREWKREREKEEEKYRYSLAGREKKIQIKTSNKDGHKKNLLLKPKL